MRLCNNETGSDAGEKKKNDLIVQQLGDYFYGELAHLFGPEPEIPEMPINESFIKTANLLSAYWQYCDITNSYEGVHNGELTLALNTSYAFAHIPDKQNLRDINGIRKSYTDSLTTMCRLIDLLRDSCEKI